LITITKWQSR